MEELFKLVHFTDLNGKDKYYLLINNGIELRQQEINAHEYLELKSAEKSHYEVEIKKLKHKYELLNKEKV